MKATTFTSIKQLKYIFLGFFTMIISSQVNGQDPVPGALFQSAIKLFNPYVSIYKPKFRQSFYQRYPLRHSPTGSVFKITTIDLKKDSKEIETFDGVNLIKKESHYNGIVDKKIYFYSDEGLLDSLKILNPKLKAQNLSFTYDDMLLSSTTINEKTTNHISLNEFTQVNIKPESTTDTLVYDRSGNLIYEATHTRVDKDILTERKFQTFDEKNQIIAYRSPGYTVRNNEIIMFPKDIRINASYYNNGFVKTYTYGNFKDNQLQLYLNVSYQYDISKNEEGGYVIAQIGSDKVSKKETRRIYTFDEQMNWTSYQELVDQKLIRELKREIIYE